MPAYDPQNPFAKILRGEFPCHKVYENDHVLAFLDIMPRAPGHTLIIPKAGITRADDFAARSRPTASPWDNFPRPPAGKSSSTCTCM